MQIFKKTDQFGLIVTSRVFIHIFLLSTSDGIERPRA